MYGSLNSFIHRLAYIDIHVELVGNYPWVYIDTINGDEVTEVYMANHGFCLGVMSDEDIVFNDLTDIFKLIRKYDT